MNWKGCEWKRPCLGYWLDECDSIPDRAGVKTGSGLHPVPSPMLTGFLSGVKRPRHEANHSPPSSAEIKNAWNYTSTPPCLHTTVLT
jgi:hypothetical protein